MTRKTSTRQDNAYIVFECVAIITGWTLTRSCQWVRLLLKARKLREEGSTWREIAEETGVKAAELYNMARCELAQLI